MSLLTLYKFNNKSIKQLQNPKYNSLNRPQQGRTNDCQTPFRNPYNHWRKVSTCGNCDTNEKITVDSVAQNFSKDTCYNPYIRNILNKNGVRDSKFLYSNLSLNFRRGNTFEQKNMIYNNNSSNNEYKISPEEIPGTEIVYFRNDCQTSIIKYANRNFNKNSAVTSKNRLNRLKYNTVLNASKDNAVNGTLISIQGVSHHNAPPYRNNKNIDSYDTVGCTAKTRKNVCSANQVNKGKKKREKFYFAKKQYRPPSYYNHNNIFMGRRSNGNNYTQNQNNSNTQPTTTPTTSTPTYTPSTTTTPTTTTSGYY